MGSYVPGTGQEQQEMLSEIGCDSFDVLFSQIPEEVRLQGRLNLPEGLSELEVSREMERLAGQNRVYRHIFRGAGAYNHYIPAIVKSVVSKESFVTAYTPYQAEISQGVLQSIFEYQTLICRLTGMDVSNASVYDGACAAAEATAMCLDRKRKKVFVSETANPAVAETIRTYCFGNGSEMVMVPASGGHTDADALRKLLGLSDGASDSGTSCAAACFYVEQPNYYGQIEDCSGLGELVHQAGARFIMGCNPIALAILKTPAECGADIAVGEGQPLGMPLSWGGPYLGYMAATKDMMRRLPGRIVGETVDSEGRRAFVLTLQAREQHIRREKAGSNICSNEALCALTAAVYLSAMGSDGLQEAARQCCSKAHYLKDSLESIGYTPLYTGEFFHEFVTVSDTEASAALEALAEHDILGGLPLGSHEILWCATEKNTREEIDEAVSVLKGVSQR